MFVFFVCLCSACLTAMAAYACTNIKAKSIQCVGITHAPPGTPLCETKQGVVNGVFYQHCAGDGTIAYSGNYGIEESNGSQIVAYEYPDCFWERICDHLTMIVHIGGGVTHYHYRCTPIVTTMYGIAFVTGTCGG